MSEWKPGIPPRLEGYGVLLRTLAPAEVDDALVAQLRNPEVSRTLALGRNPEALTRENLQDRITRFDNRRNFFLGIFALGSGKRLGFCWCLAEGSDSAALSAAVTDPQLWRQGVSGSAIYLLRCFLFEAVKLHKLVARAYAENAGVIRGLEEWGWVREGVLREAEPDGKGGRRDVHVFGMLRAEHVAGRKPRTYKG